MPLALRLEGALDPAALQRALAALVARHGVLRTTFSIVDGRPVQVIRASLDLPLPLTVLDEGTRADQDAALASELAQRRAGPSISPRGRSSALASSGSASASTCSR